MNSMGINCSLCNSLTIEGQRDNSNRILCETANFALIPSIGPLTLGHVLIVSKAHFESLAEMGSEMIMEFNHFLNKIIDNESESSDYLIFEHGSYDGQKGGSCVTHTHIHLIPELGCHYNLLDGVLKAVQINSITALSNVEMPYILSINNKNGLRLYEAYNVHSQMMRKALCAILNITEWDWRINNNESLINSSIKYWESKIKHER